MKPYITGCLVTIATVLISYFYIRNGIELDVITGLTWGLYSGITHYLRKEHKPESTKIQVAWPTFLVLIVVSSVYSLNLLNDKFSFLFAGFILLSFGLGELSQFLNQKRDKYVEVCVVENDKQLSYLKKLLSHKKIPFTVTTFQEFYFNEDGEKKSVAGRLYAPAEFKEEILNILSSKERCS